MERRHPKHRLAGAPLLAKFVTAGPVARIRGRAIATVLPDMANHGKKRAKAVSKSVVFLRGKAVSRNLLFSGHARPIFADAGGLKPLSFLSRKGSQG